MEYSGLVPLTQHWLWFVQYLQRLYGLLPLFVVPQQRWVALVELVDADVVARDRTAELDIDVTEDADIEDTHTAAMVQRHLSRPPPAYEVLSSDHHLGHDIHDLLSCSATSC